MKRKNFSIKKCQKLGARLASSMMLQFEKCQGDRSRVVSALVFDFYFSSFYRNSLDGYTQAKANVVTIKQSFIIITRQINFFRDLIKRREELVQRGGRKMNDTKAKRIVRKWLNHLRCSMLTALYFFSAVPSPSFSEYLN
jgi:hypothetical protein